jgi:hypothetical protein
VTNNIAIAEIKIKHEPAEPVAPLIIISTKEHVHDLLISHASLILGQREEEQLLRVNAKAIFTSIEPVAGTNPQFHLIVSYDKLPQTKMAVKPAQLADIIEGSHPYGRRMISKVADTKVKSWVKFPPI